MVHGSKSNRIGAISFTELRIANPTSDFVKRLKSTSPRSYFQIFQIYYGFLCTEYFPRLATASGEPPIESLTFSGIQSKSSRKEVE